MMTKNKWYNYIWSYNHAYVAIDEKGVHYFNKRGELLTSSYTTDSEQVHNISNMKEVKTLSPRYQEVLADNGEPTGRTWEYTTCVEFTTMGIIYGLGSYLLEGDNIIESSFDYFFASYDGE